MDLIAGGSDLRSSQRADADHAAMRWKAENLCLFDAKLVCGTEGKAEMRRVIITARSRNC